MYATDVLVLSVGKKKRRQKSTNKKQNVKIVYRGGGSDIILSA